MEEGAGNDELPVIFNVCAVPDPQLLLAVTEIVPIVLPAVTVIELVVELPVHPGGKVHV